MLEMISLRLKSDRTVQLPDGEFWAETDSEIYVRYSAESYVVRYLKRDWEVVAAASRIVRDEMFPGTLNALGRLTAVAASPDLRS